MRSAASLTSSPSGPTTALAEVSAIGGGQDTSSVGARGDLGNAQWQQLLAADSFRTAGYIPTAPSVAGPVDTPANVHDQAVRTETDRTFANSNRAFLIGNMLNEARANGTPIQTNATRLWRYIGGDDWSVGAKGKRPRPPLRQQRGLSSKLLFHQRNPHLGNPHPPPACAHPGTRCLHRRGHPLVAHGICLWPGRARHPCHR